jgi:hypothetical protein
MTPAWLYPQTYNPRGALVLVGIETHSHFVKILIEALGMLSRLPLEIREEIYGFVLYINVCESYGYDLSTSCYPRIAILQVSNQVYNEAVGVLYTVSEFKIAVTQLHRTRGIGGTILVNFVNVNFLHAAADLDIESDRKIWPPKHRLKYARNWELRIAPETGILESDIAGYMNLLDAVAEVCKFLSQCQQIHQLRVKIKIDEPEPFGTELLLGPILKLRNIRQTYFDVSSTIEASERDWQAWHLKRSYGCYMSRVMALPEGTDAGGYTNVDEDENEKKTRGIFEYVEVDSEDDSSTYSWDSVYRNMITTWVTVMNEIGGSHSSSELSFDASGAPQEDNGLVIQSNETISQDAFDF